MISKALALSVLLVLLSAAGVALVVQADCVLPREIWRLELASVEAVDGTADTMGDALQLGENVYLIGYVIDSKRPAEDRTVHLRGAVDASGGPAWSLTLKEAEDD